MLTSKALAQWRALFLVFILAVLNTGCAELLRGWVESGTSASRGLGPTLDLFNVRGVKASGSAIDYGNYINSASNFVVSWETVTNAAQYQVLITKENESAEVCPIMTKGADTTVAAFENICTLQEGQPYVATVRALNSKGKSVAATYSFRVDLTPPALTFLDPSANKTIIVLSYDISWSSSDSGSGLAANYVVEKFSNATCSGGALLSSQVTSTNYALSSLADGSSYSIKVTASDKSGNSTTLCSPSIAVNQSAPTLTLSDPGTSSTSWAKQAGVSASIGNDATANRWCLSESQSTAPANSGTSCTGGVGPANGWYTSRPTSITLSAGDGNKTVYLWVADNAGNVLNVAVNDAIGLDTANPSASITATPPSPDNDSTPSFQFTMSDTGGSGIAAQDCKMDSGSYSSCTSPLTWTSLADGSHTLTIRATDNAGNTSTDTYTWNLNTISISGGTFFFTQNSTAWTQTFTISGGTGSFTYSLPTMPAGASVNASAQVSYTPGATGQYSFVLRATDSTTGFTKDYSFTLDSYPAGVCVWNGSTGTTWNSAANWSYCGGSFPIATSDVAIPAGVPNMPTILASITLNSFGSGPGGGTVTLNAAVVLTLTSNTQTFRSSVKFQGSTTNCATCSVRAADNLYIIDNAVVTLLKGISFAAANQKAFFVGNGATGGTLATGPAGTQAEWPKIGIATGVAANSGINLNGASGQLAKLDIDGAIISEQYPYTVNAQVYFNNWYQLVKFDNVLLDEYSTGADIAGIRFNDCTNATISDTTWTNITFKERVLPGTAPYNVMANGTSCASLPTITISAPAGTTGGFSYGSDYENDPNSKITWSSSGNFTCTWNGSADTAWTNPANWTNCANGRGNYPDQLDSVIIPVTATQPVVSTITPIKQFALGAGGGTITINAGASLVLMSTTSSIRSSVKLQGATTTCSTCSLAGSGNIEITDGATLTLLKGFRVNLTYAYASLRVGNGVTGGNLATGPAGLSTEYPWVIGGNASSTYYVTVQGAAGSLSSLNLDGFGIWGTSANSATLLTLQDYYEVQKLDNVTIDGALSIASMSTIKLTSCTNATFTDTTWDNLNLVKHIPLGAFNINASGTNCNLIPAITVSNTAGTNGGMGYGADYESDTGNVINWSNSTNNTCTWTGTASTAWTNSANWSGCANGRGGYPDQLDYVIIPVTATQPTISASTAIRGFALDAGGGGTITINANMTLYLTATTNTIRSNVTLQGGTTTCSTCFAMGSGNVEVIGASLTLGKGIRLSVPWPYTSLKIGNGVIGGTFATGAAGLTTEYPAIAGANASSTNILIFNGASGSPAVANIDGLNLNGAQGNADNSIIFQDWYTIQNFDKVGVDAALINTARAFIKFSICTNAVVTDTSWAAHNYVKAVPAGSYAINASGTNCNLLPVISQAAPTGLGVGACSAQGTTGCATESDPNSKIDWN